MHWPKIPFVAILSHSGPDFGYKDWTIWIEGSQKKIKVILVWVYFSCSNVIECFMENSFTAATSYKRRNIWLR